MGHADKISQSPATRTLVEELVCRTVLRMDAMDFPGFLSLCDDRLHYVISAFSPEIRKDMTWFENNHATLKQLFETLPKHNSDRARLSRHVSVYTVEFAADGGTADVVSALQVYRTELDGGATELFAIGKMYDKVALNAGGALLLERHIKLETRMFGIGFHIPF
jgi:methanesulfonate monooxygenase subunit beta